MQRHDHKRALLSCDLLESGISKGKKTKRYQDKEGKTTARYTRL